ncbi:hypothetical protein HXA35_10360 [Bacillus sp. A301a_S52]|jgi:hypothetical protein|nr:hypothetical protein [Bacillus sp. A301a_S52]
MDILTILILIVIGIVLLRIVGAIFRIVITIGLIMLIIYVVSEALTLNTIVLVKPWQLMTVGC